MRYVDTERPTDEQVRLLYQVQEDLYQKISENLSDYDIRLIGGTALSRCYLNHRISFDIYISINPDDRIALKKILALTQIPNVTLLNTSALNDKNYSFSFFRYRQSNLNVEFSVVEDRMFQYYEPSTQVMGNTQVNTVTLKTLYLNKIRTIAGDMPGFARQKLRDVFDVFVLSKECSPISDFLVEIEQKIPFLCQDRFYENLSSMPWYDFFSEKIFAIGKWQNFEEIDKLSNALYAEASMEQVDEDGQSPRPEGRGL